MWRRLRNVLAGLGAAATAACATPQAAAPRAEGPALWKLADADTTIYLFGTIHLLPEGLDWRTPVLDRAIAGSQELVLETKAASDTNAAAAAMLKLGTSEGLPPLSQRVPAEKRAALAKLIADTGVPAGALDRMETWAAALTLLAIQFRKLGFNPDLGVEKGLAVAYQAGAKPISGLETVEQQFGFFDQLSEEAQRTFLAGMLDRPGETKAQFEAMLEAWRTGDTEAIAATFDSETALMPELRDVLMRQRNARWAAWLEQRLERPGTAMVAVGAGHLAGADSVQALLAQRGLKAERLQ